MVYRIDVSFLIEISCGFKNVIACGKAGKHSFAIKHVVCVFEFCGFYFKKINCVHAGCVKLNATALVLIRGFHINDDAQGLYFLKNK